MDSANSKTKEVHHDTHATPPHFVQEAYWRYNRIKFEELEKDQNVIDFGRGLAESQRSLFRPVNTIKASTIETACKAFRKKALRSDSDKSLRSALQDVIVYEHVNFPGLQIAPSVLPPETQVLFVSQVMGPYLANPKHKNNLEADYNIDFPEPSAHAQSQVPSSDNHDPRDPALAPISSFFSYSNNSVPLQPKTSSTQKPLNAAQFLEKKLRWLTLGEQYDWPTRSYPPNTPTTFPSDLYALVTTLFPHIVPESGVCLLYGGKDYMPVHRDVSEQCQTGLASFSFGCDGIFVVAKGDEEIDDESEKQNAIAVFRVRSGDCVHMEGEARWCWHAMPRTIPGTCPEWLEKWPALDSGDDEAARWTEKERKAFAKWKGYMGRKRLNVSCRQVWS